MIIKYFLQPINNNLSNQWSFPIVLTVPQVKCVEICGWQRLPATWALQR